MPSPSWFAASAAVLSSLLSLAAVARAEPSPAETSGSLKILTYNVAGLPDGISRSKPVQNLPQISGRLGRYDLALIQEDFAYPDKLREHLRMTYASPGFVRGEQLHFGDGLSVFSKLRFDGLVRTAWTACHGYVDAYFDCLTPKGFALARLELSPGVTIDVYNLHLDAGRTADDLRARERQLEQLAAAVRTDSAEHAFIIGGDFNLSSRERDRFQSFLADVGADDACRTLGCPEPWRIDKIVLRSTPSLKLIAKSWSLDQTFQARDGQPLSDHLAVAVSVAWYRPSIPGS